MTDATDPTDALADAVDRMGLDRAPRRDRALAAMSLGIMTLGPVLALVAYLVSQSTNDVLRQRDMTVLALFGVSLTILGGFVFLRYSVVTYFRFWAARIVAEIGKAQSPDA